MRSSHNVAFNLIGFVFPAVVLFVSYPPFLHALGPERFGILTLAMSLAAGLSFLDFGLTAASLRFVASDVHQGELVSAARVITASLSFFGGLGLAISLALFALAPYVVGWMSIASAQMDEAVVIFRLTAMQVACSLFLGTLCGLFKAMDRFDLAAATLSLLSLAIYGEPAFQVSTLGHSLSFALACTDVTLFVMCLVGVKLLSKVADTRGVPLRSGRPDRLTYRRIFGFGVTLTVHTLIGQIFTHGQRILVGFLFGPVSLTSYQLSLTLVSKVHAAINAIAEVALPVASTAQHDLIKRTYARGMSLLIVMSVVPLAAIAALSHFVLGLWLGAALPTLAERLLPIMCLAYVFVALSALPYHILNGLGHPGVNVAFAVFNVLLYGVGLAVMEFAHLRSVTNVAWAYAASNVICGIFFQMYCYRVIVRLPAGYVSSHATSISSKTVSMS